MPRWNLFYIPPARQSVQRHVTQDGREIMQECVKRERRRERNTMGLVRGEEKSGRIQMDFVLNNNRTGGGGVIIIMIIMLGQCPDPHTYSGHRNAGPVYVCTRERERERERETYSQTRGLSRPINHPLDGYTNLSVSQPHLGQQHLHL